MNPTNQTENYTPGHNLNSTNFMAERDMESHGFFLKPLLGRNTKVLDVGCGPGTITAGIAEAVFPGEITGVDVCSLALERARRIAEGRELINMRFVQAPAQNLPLPDASYDVVFAHALLEHLAKPELAVREIFRTTKHGGFFAACSPDWDAFAFSPATPELLFAISAYRQLQERNGGHTNAGMLLGRWQASAGFIPLSLGTWMEEYDDSSRIADYLARQLEQAGELEHAQALRDWAQIPGAAFRQCWRYAISLKLD